MGNSFELSDRDIRAIKQSAGVLGATGIYTQIGSVVKNGQRKYAAITSYDPSTPMAMHLMDLKIAKGRQLNQGDFREATLGYNYMLKNKIFPKPYSLNEKINIQGQKVRIIGFYKSVGNPQDDSSIYVTNKFMHHLYPNKTLSYYLIIAQVDTNHMKTIAENIKRKLRERSEEHTSELQSH